MATVPYVYSKAMKNLGMALIDFEDDTIVCLLLDSGHTPSQTTHEFIADVVADELSGGSYARVTLTGKSIDVATTIVRYKASSPVFSGITAADIRYAVFAKSTGSDATSPLLSIMDFGESSEATAEDVTVVIPSTIGVLRFNVA